MGLEKAQTDGLWVNAARNGISVPTVNCGQDAPHFYDLSEKDRMGVSCWLLLNTRPAKPGTPAAYMTSQEVAELASFFTGICLNSTQAREALLLLAIAPWDLSEQHAGAGGAAAPCHSSLGRFREGLGIPGGPG